MSRARGRHVLPWLRRNRTNRLKVLMAPALMALGLASIPASAAATSYYVATTGNDSNLCISAGSPCLTIAGAIAKASAGDTIYVAAGTYSAASTVIDKSLTILGDSGTPGVAGPGPSAPVIDGGNTVKDGFRIANGVSGVTISGFVIRNLAADGFTNGTGVGVQAYVQSTSAVTVSQNRFTNVGYGVLAGNDGSSLKYALGTHSNWTISGNIVEGIYSAGIEITDTSDSSVIGNLVHMSQRDISHTGPIGIFSWAYIDQKNLTVQGNTIDGTLASYPAIYMYAYPAATYTPYSSAAGKTVVASSTLDGVTITNNLMTATLAGLATHQVQIRAINRTIYPGAVTNIRVQDNSLATLRNRDTTSTMLATNNWWGQSSGPGVNQTSGTMTVSPWTTSYTLDPARANSPGFWPAAAGASLTESAEPQTLTLAGPTLGSPAITIPSAPAGATVTVSATEVSDLPVVTTPFKVSDATLIDISVSEGVTGPFTICLNGVPGTDHLWHYEGDAWVDMTGRQLPSGTLDPNDYPAGQICGMTATLSPFAIAEDRVGTQEDCTLGDNNRLNVPIPAGGTLSVARDGTDLWIGGPTVWCGAEAKTIGSGNGQVRTLVITGTGDGGETVVFLEATSGNWGSNSPTNLLRSVSAVGTIVLQGTPNADTISVSTMVSISGSPTVRLEGGDGIDLLTGSSTTDVFIGGAGDDTFRGGTGNDCADYSAESVAVTASLTTGKGTGTGLGTDTYNSIECLKGGSGNDVLTGSAYADSLYGNGGNDTLSGRAGNDTLDGGADTDTVSYAEQAYPVTAQLQAPAGGGGGSTIGTDTFVGIENLTGGAASDALSGDSGNNVLDGGAGNDLLVGMQGDDTFIGGAGTDRLSYDDGNFGAGAASTGVVVSLATVGTGQDTVGAGIDTISGGIENLTGSSYGDSLTGDGLVNTIYAGDGNDTVTAGAGNDIVYGQTGDDTLSGGLGADTLRGGDDVDLLFGEGGADVLYGDAGNDVLRGGTEGDTLRGGDGNDILVGGLVGTGGVDLMYGELGSDTVSYDDVTYPDAATGSGVVFKLSSVGTQQAVGGGAGIDVAGDSIENLTGTQWNDTLVGNSLANTIEALGGAGNKVDGQAGTDSCTTTGGWAAGYPKLCP